MPRTPSRAGLYSRDRGKEVAARGLGMIRFACWGQPTLGSPPPGLVKSYYVPKSQSGAERSLVRCVRWLDESGEELSRQELQKALAALLAEGKIEQKGDLYRRATPKGAKSAFDSLFGE